MSQHDDFWKIAWDEGRTRFHQSKVNPVLANFFAPKSNKTCLVPLCGKSLDLLFLAKHFDKVVGMELVEKPIIEFFEENQIPFQRKGNHFASEKIDIYLADFIQDELDHLGKFDYIYDRASMVAIEDKYRADYIKRIKNYKCPDQGVIHLVTFERENLGGGPPFDIPHLEVMKFYDGHGVELVDETKRELTSSQGENLKVYRRIYHIA